MICNNKNDKIICYRLWTTFDLEDGIKCTETWCASITVNGIDTWVLAPTKEKAISRLIVGLCGIK